MKIGGNQAETFPDLPIQSRTLEFNRKTEKIASKMFKKSPKKVQKLYVFDVLESIFQIFLLNSEILAWIGRSGKVSA